MMERMKTVKKLGNLLEIDGVLYRPDFSKESKKEEMLGFKRVLCQKEYLAKVDKIAKKLAPKLDAEEVVRNSLLDMDTKKVRRVYDSLFKKKSKPKINQHHGCYEMEVGNEVIPIR